MAGRDWILKTAPDGDPHCPPWLIPAPPNVGTRESTAEGGHCLLTEKRPPRTGSQPFTHLDFLGDFTPCDMDAWASKT